MLTGPGPRPAELTDPAFHARGAFALWAWMREHAPVHWHEPSLMPGFWSLTRYHDVRAVYRDPRRFSSARGVLLRPRQLGEDPGGGLTMALTDPPRHRQLRSLVAGRFSERYARSLGPVLDGEVRAVLRDAIERRECDLVHDIGARLSIHAICRILGVPGPDRERILEWSGEAFAAGQPLTSHQEIMRYFIELMFARMRCPADDAMSQLVHGEPGGEPLTETEILLNCENLVGATENAGISMAAGLLAFVEHPGQWQRLRQDAGLMPTAVEEVLRWSSSATHSMRTATEDMVIRGRTIRAGDRVVLWIPAANRDPAAFPDPDRFDVARQPNRHLALGTGEHVCIGGTLARHQTRALLRALIETGASIELDGPVAPLRSLAVNGPASAPARITLT